MTELPDYCSECGAPVECIEHVRVEGVLQNEFNRHYVKSPPRVTRIHEAPLYFSEPINGRQEAGFCSAKCSAAWHGRRTYRRRLTNDDIAMFDAALFASMTIVDDGRLVE